MTLSEIQQQEAMIWGSTTHPSKVIVEVTEQPTAPDPIHVFEYGPTRNGKKRLRARNGMEEIAYGAFPLQPSQEAQRGGADPGVLFGYRAKEFALRVTCPEDVRPDVETALWAWESFGGLGGRTRRGFGAIQRTDSPSNSPASIEQRLAGYSDFPRIDGLPSLSGAKLAVSSSNPADAIQAWKIGLGALQRLRQGPGVGRNAPSGNTGRRAGRSFWPEADEIRKLTGQAASNHKKPFVAVDRFPRAAFGMPIVFHFNPGSRDDPGSQGDPDVKPLTLQPRSAERLASPLILRPVAHGAGFRAMGLVLHTPTVEDAVLIAGTNRFDVRTRLDLTTAKAIRPLTVNKQIETDPLERFLHELRQC